MFYININLIRTVDSVHSAYKYQNRLIQKLINKPDYVTYLEVAITCKDETWVSKIEMS